MLLEMVTLAAASPVETAIPLRAVAGRPGVAEVMDAVGVDRDVGRAGREPDAEVVLRGRGLEVADVVVRDRAAVHPLHVETRRCRIAFAPLVLSSFSA